MLGRAGSGHALSDVVRGFYDDVAEAIKSTTALEQFGDRLAQSYEEVNVLFQTAGLLKDIADPAVALTAVCERMAETLAFGWVRLRFAGETDVPAAVAGRSLSAGDPPGGSNAFDRMLDAVLATADDSVCQAVHTVADSPIARAAGAEAIVQRVTRDGRSIGLLVAGGKVGGDPDVTSGEIRFLEAAAQLIGVFVENVARFDEQRAMFLGTLRAMTASIDAKDPYTRGHSERVAHLAAITAAALGLDERTVERFRVAGLLHDVGKIGVPEAVLRKAARLDDAEFALIKKHPEIGHGILRDIPGLADVLPGVLHHHEKWDGHGYPHGVAGETIPLVARVLALADTFDAMSSSRAYRAAMPRERVLAEIRRCAGTQFDPAVVPAFVGLDFSEFDRMVASAAAQDVAPVAA
ncbi:MAG TPA: HD-GYP domain-containing protein [Tepidisphaeraceae bacterium]|nr:HD-GYP domain-containing protein [Tepidisphaeraceae bacterium]